MSRAKFQVAEDARPRNEMRTIRVEIIVIPRPGSSAARCRRCERAVLVPTASASVVPTASASV